MYQALNATSKTLLEMLRAQINADAFLNGAASPWKVRSMDVQLMTPAEMVDNDDEGISLWLYRVVRDPERLNEGPRRISATQSLAPPLPLRLHYLITPITSRDNDGDPDTEQYILGKVMQVFHSRATLSGAALRGELVGTDTELRVRLETLTIEEVSRIWDAIDSSYQLCVSYEVSVVNIDAALEAQVFVPVQVVLPDIGLITGSAP